MPFLGQTWSFLHDSHVRPLIHVRIWRRVSVSHIICRNYQWFFIQCHVLCCARADQLGDHATRCGFSKMVLQLQLIHLYGGSVSEFLNEFPDRWIFWGAATAPRQCHGFRAFRTWLHLITACGVNKKQSGSVSLEHQRWIKPSLLMPSPL